MIEVYPLGSFIAQGYMNGPYFLQTLFTIFSAVSLGFLWPISSSNRSLHSSLWAPGSKSSGLCWLSAPLVAVGFLSIACAEGEQEGMLSACCSKTPYKAGILRLPALLLKPCSQSVKWDLIFGLMRLLYWACKDLQTLLVLVLQN